jgi:hypothetical protein
MRSGLTVSQWKKYDAPAGSVWERNATLVNSGLAAQNRREPNKSLGWAAPPSGVFDPLPLATGRCMLAARGYGDPPASKGTKGNLTMLAEAVSLIMRTGACIIILSKVVDWIELAVDDIKPMRALSFSRTLQTIRMPGRLRIPEGRIGQTTRLGPLLISVTETREVLFRNKPTFWYRKYVFYARVFDDAGMIALDIRAPYSIFLLYVGMVVCAVGMIGVFLESEGPVSAGVIAIAIVLLGLMQRGMYRRHAGRTVDALADIRGFLEAPE